MFGAMIIVTSLVLVDQPANASVLPPAVEIARVPDGGIQPQVAVGTDGVAHLLYYKGDAKAGDLFYVHRGAGEAEWSKAVRVNSEAGSAVAIGNNRGGQIALSKDGAVHIAWNGSGTATPKGPAKSSPMLYARLLPGSAAFSPQKNLMMVSSQLDGGGSVAADGKGNVFVVWHGHPVDANEKGEVARRVFVAASSDGGATFAPERVVSEAENGACGCCGLKAAAMPGGDLLVLYRAAAKGIHRDTQLLRSTDAGKTFTDTKLEAWELNACPMSTASITPTTTGAALAWETAHDIRWAALSASGIPGELSGVGPKGARRRFPVIATDGEGRTLVTWTEGMGWNTGGRMRWQVFDSAGKAIDKASGSTEGVPVWSLVAAVAKPTGGFVVLY